MTQQIKAQGDTEPLELALERSIDAPGQARAALAELCEERAIGRSRCQTLMLLVSEVVSNAVLHSHGPSDSPIEIHASEHRGSVRVTVTDAGAGFLPVERDPARVEGGYGLYLLEKAASSWGVDASGPTSVWFELAAPA